MERANEYPASGDAGATWDSSKNTPLNNQPRPLPQAPSAWKRAAIDTLTVLRAKFPLCFARLDLRSRTPLKVGIHADILTAAPEIDPSDLGKALHLYTRHAGYLAQCVEGQPRIDLSGQPAGALTAAEAEHARTLLAKIKGGHQRQRQTEPAAPPHKLSLSDLKAAAVRKRTVAGGAS